MKLQNGGDFLDTLFLHSISSCECNKVVKDNLIKLRFLLI